MAKKRRSTKKKAVAVTPATKCCCEDVNLFRITQIIIGGIAILMGIFLLSAKGYLDPATGLAFLFGIFAMMTGMRG